ncbi:MAG: hypothetical protein SVZ03_17455 [Spirochaetota bacterium]|nr:hypothetical protein [Spirochaetota bacterium]
MNRILLALFIALFPIYFVSGDEEPVAGIGSSELDEITPASAILFVRVSGLDKTIGIVSYIFNNIIFNDYSVGVTQWVNTFKRKTDIDIYDVQSVRKAGIDTKRPLALACLKGKGESEDMLIFLPIKSDNFYLKFIKIIQRANTNRSDIDLDPIIASYKRHRVGQVLKDIFFTTVDDYFILTSSGGSIKRIIDLKAGETNEISIVDDPLYKAYKGRIERISDINIFLKREFVKEYIYNKDVGGNKYKTSSLKEKAFIKKQYISETEKTDTGQREFPKRGQIKKESKLDSINYIGLSLKIESTEIDIKVDLGMNNESLYAKTLKEILKIGMAGRALYVENPLVYYYSSIDTKVLQSIWKRGNNVMSDGYDLTLFTKNITHSFGIDLTNYFVSYPIDFYNFVIEKSKLDKGFDNYIIFYPLQDKSENSKLWKSIKKEMDKKYRKTGRFGEEGGGIDSFWYKSLHGNKMNFVAIDRGFCIGNNLQFLYSTINTIEKNICDMNYRQFKKVDNQTFFVSYVKFDEGNQFKQILMLLTSSKPALYRLINRMRSVFVIGKRVDSNLSFDMRINFCQ